MGSLCPPEARPPGTVISYWQQSSNSWKRHPQKITPFKGNFLVPSHLGTFQICLGLVKSLLPQELADPIDQAMRAGVTCCRPATLTIPNTWVMWYHLKSSPVEVWHTDKPWFGIILFMASNLYSSCLIFHIPRHGMSQKWGALFGFKKCALGDKKGHLILRHPHISIFSTVHALWPVADPDHEADPEDLPQKQLEKIQDNKRVVYLNQFAILYGLVMDYIYKSRKCLRRGWGWLQFFYLLWIWSAGYMWGGLRRASQTRVKGLLGFCSHLWNDISLKPQQGKTMHFETNIILLFSIDDWLDLMWENQSTISIVLASGNHEHENDATKKLWGLLFPNLWQVMAPKESTMEMPCPKAENFCT